MENHKVAQEKVMCSVDSTNIKAKHWQDENLSWSTDWERNTISNLLSVLLEQKLWLLFLPHCIMLFLEEWSISVKKDKRINHFRWHTRAVSVTYQPWSGEYVLRRSRGCWHRQNRFSPDSKPWKAFFVDSPPVKWLNVISVAGYAGTSTSSCFSRSWKYLATSVLAPIDSADTASSSSLK